MALTEVSCSLCLLPPLPPRLSQSPGGGEQVVWAPRAGHLVIARREEVEEVMFLPKGKAASVVV